MKIWGVGRVGCDVISRAEAVNTQLKNESVFDWLLALTWTSRCCQLRGVQGPDSRTDAARSHSCRVAEVER